MSAKTDAVEHAHGTGFLAGAGGQFSKEEKTCATAFNGFKFFDPSLIDESDDDDEDPNAAGATSFDFTCGAAGATSFDVTRGET